MTHDADIKPNTVQRNLAKLPAALAPLIKRPQWAIWRWTQKPDGNWQKPPFMATQPDRHASTNDSSTWSDYATALAAVQAGDADGISYILTKDDPFGAIDLDNCRNKLCSIDIWAQNFMQAAVNTYSEVTPSGEGVRIWGYADAGPLNKKFTLEDNGKPIAAELFRRTNKALTITGATLDRSIHQFTNIDGVFDWAIAWGERRKAAQVKPAVSVNGNGFDSNGCKYSIDDIERLVSGDIQPANRSDAFHTIIGHYVGCGWQPDRIHEHLQQYPDGIGSRYLREDRLQQEIERCAGKFAQSELPLSGSNTGWTGWAPEPEAPAREKEPPPVDHDLDDELLDDDDQAQPDDGLDDELGGELGDQEPDEEAPQPDPNLPPLYAHGDPDPRPLRSWLVEDLIPEVGHGLIAGQWGAGKTAVFLELARAVMTGQPFIDYTVARQCGVLLIAVEGQHDIRPRLEALSREKCGSMPRMPFRWYEAAPPLLHKDAVKTLVAMARQAEASLNEEFGLPLGLIGIDTLAAAAGYSQSGAEQDNAVGQATMNVMKTIARELGCFVLPIDHFGKTPEAGTRGASSKEGSGDAVLACLGEKQLDGSVTNTRLAIRKNRSGRQGRVCPFNIRVVDLPQLRKDGKPETAIVVDWTKGSTEASPPPDDPWVKAKRQDQRTAVLRLKRVLEEALAEDGIAQPTEPNGPTVQMVDQELVREAFYASTPAEGTAKQKRQARHTQFKSALSWTEQKRLIGIGEIKDVTYLWLVQPDPTRTKTKASKLSVETSTLGREVSTPKFRRPRNPHEEDCQW